MAFFVEGVRKFLEPRDQVRRIGEFAPGGAAIEAAQKTVDGFLQDALRPGMDARALFALYQDRGEYPFIFRDDDRTFNVPGFNHVRYAMARAGELCGGNS